VRRGVADRLGHPLIIETSNGVRLMADVPRDGANLHEGNDVEVTLPSARLCAFAEDRS